MKNILGIDYGRRKIGLAISTEGKLATPYKVFKVSSEEAALNKLNEVFDKDDIDEIVMGLSEGKMATETKKFAKKLSDKLGTNINFQDETLTTRDAQEKSIDAGLRRKKRKEMEDAYSATLILQNYLDETINK